MNILTLILKKVFPRVFLKRVFLVYNKLKINTWDKIFFRSELLSSKDYISEEKNPFLELNIEFEKFDQQVRNKLAIWVNPEWKQNQYLLKYDKPGFLEPRIGWAISLSKHLVFPSLGFAEAHHVHKPSLIDLYLKKNTVVHLNKIISLRDTGEENYFHFFNDVLPKLYFLQDREIDISTYTVVISYRLFEKPYFKFFMNTNVFGNLQWHIQGADQWIKFEKAIFCKPYTHTKKYFDRSIELARKTPGNHSGKRFFLTRSRSSLRFIENFSSLIPILNKLNFEVVETSQLSFEQQVNYFSDCRYLVAIHGAGITNIMFRSGYSLSLLEILQPSPYIPFHYVMLCKLYNYNYDVLLGYEGKESGQGGFFVDPLEFEKKLLSLVSTS